MSSSDIVSLVLTIILGIVSIGLGFFSIWLSLQFNHKSNEALDAIKELANEIRNLSLANISQQKDFSSKMLDSILARDQFGISDENRPAILEHVIKRQLQETELRITTGVENRVRELVSSINTTDNPNAVQQTLEFIRSDIKLLTSEASSVSTNIELPDKLYEHLIGFREFPAYFVLLTAMVKDNIKSITEMERYADKYYFPKGWEAALQNLISKNILSGSPDSFDVIPKYQTPLAAFIDKNWTLIQQLVDLYKLPTNRNGQTVEEIQLAKSFII